MSNYLLLVSICVLSSSSRQSSGNHNNYNNNWINSSSTNSKQCWWNANMDVSSFDWDGSSLCCIWLRLFVEGSDGSITLLMNVKRIWTLSFWHGTHSNVFIYCYSYLNSLLHSVDFALYNYASGKKDQVATPSTKT